MTQKELATILKYAEVDEDNEVKVEVRYPSGTREYCTIVSVMVYSDGISLTVWSNKE